MKKVRDIIKRIEEDGWHKVAQKGSHRQYKHAVKKGRVTIPGQPGDDLPPGLEKSIRQQAQLEKEK
jgi:predicted RNA binding protein YcfA (HicA-like mRNA interferase family)